MVFMANLGRGLAMLLKILNNLLFTRSMQNYGVRLASISVTTIVPCYAEPKLLLKPGSLPVRVVSGSMASTQTMNILTTF
jgi:hypothetical protein